jgi:hypothetical protein
MLFPSVFFFPLTECKSLPLQSNNRINFSVSFTLQCLKEIACVGAWIPVHLAMSRGRYRFNPYSSTRSIGSITPSTHTSRSRSLTANYSRSSTPTTNNDPDYSPEVASYDLPLARLQELLAELVEKNKEGVMVTYDVNQCGWVEWVR